MSSQLVQKSPEKITSALREAFPTLTEERTVAIMAKLERARTAGIKVTASLEATIGSSATAGLADWCVKYGYNLGVAQTYASMTEAYNKERPRPKTIFDPQ